MSDTAVKLDAIGIMRLIPHRYPFLLIDAVTEFVPGESITAVKNVTLNEPYFQGHFPGRPVMPGVLVVEAMAQAAGVLSFATMGRRSDDNSVFYFAGIDEARFKRPVVPGDQLRLEVDILRKSRLIWKFKGSASVDGQVVAEAQLMCALRDIAGREPATADAAA